MPTAKHTPDEPDDLLPEYDFRGMRGERGKYFRAYRAGHRVTVHREDGTAEVASPQVDQEGGLQYA